jgi:hypothetical protein
MGCTVEYLSPELGIQLISSKYQSGIQNMLSFDTGRRGLGVMVFNNTFNNISVIS